MSSDPLPDPVPTLQAEAQLHAEVTGDGPIRVVLAHGFTQTGRVWGGMDRHLAADHRIVRLDLPGHGQSSSVRAGLTDGALLIGQAGGPAVYVGYSMGARFCLDLALVRPDLTAGLVLISGTAGIDDADQRHDRRRTDALLADQLDPPDGQAGLPVPTFLRRWLAGPLFAGIPPEADGFEERCTNTGAGLASSLRLAGAGTQRPSWHELSSLSCPVLIVSGADDGKFTELGRRLAASIGSNATHQVVPGTGHAPHLQRPGDVADRVRWLAGRVGPH
jgi:2-succinyl-6-hydroxy-2,4-cyclohexadiene-1-carboxylate synthase